jgi:CBS domain-containing protein
MVVEQGKGWPGRPKRRVDMTLREIMSTPIESVEASASLQDAARKMKQSNVGMLPVMSGETCVGVVTDRDLVIRGLAENSIDRRVQDVMSGSPVTCEQDADVREAIRAMEENRVGRLVVTDGGGKPVGVVSGGAITMALQGDPEVSNLSRDLSAAHSQASVR